MGNNLKELIGQYRKWKHKKTGVYRVAAFEKEIIKKHFYQAHYNKDMLFDLTLENEALQKDIKKLKKQIIYHKKLEELFE